MGQGKDRRRNWICVFPEPDQSWQITPRSLTDAMAAGLNEARRAFEAMMMTQKIDNAAIDPRGGG